MAKSKANSEPEVQVVQAPWGPVLTHAAFILTIALVIARALVSEVLRDAFEISPGAAQAPRGAGASASLILDLLCWLPAILILVRRVIEKDYLIRVRLSHLLLGALAILAALSTFWSSDKFAALVTSAHVVTAAILMWSTAQLVRSWLRLRIVAGICFGLLLAYVAQGMYYRFLDVPQTAKYWRENKDQILRDHGWAPGSFHAVQFEKKLLSGEMLGFNQSPNSYAAVIVLLIVVSAGAAIQRRLDGGPAAVTAWIIVAAFPLAVLILYYTGTKTAFGTLLIAAAIFAGIRLTREKLAQRPTLWYGMGVAAVVLIALLIVAHGMHHGSLPGASMTFRWRYWIASERILAAHPLLGVGWSNFGSHYLTVRLPIAAEEIRDPHNFIVRAFAELGIVGGLLLLGWLAAAAWELTRPIAPPPGAKLPPQSRRTIWTIIFAVALGIIINCIVAIDWSQNGAYQIEESFKRFLYFALIVIGTLAVSLRSLAAQEAEDRPAPWILYGILTALAVFFVHAMVDFVLAEPGPLMLFAALLGAAMGIRTQWTRAPRHRAVAIASLAALALVWVVAFLGFVLPVVDAEQQSAAGDEALRTSDPLRPDAPIRAAALYKSAYDRMPLNAEYAYQSARAMMYGDDNPAKIRAMLEEASARDPMSVQYHLLRAQLEAHRGDGAVAIQEYDRALALDPNNVRARLDYADSLISFNQRPKALEQIKIALSKNDQLHPDEPKRLTPDELEKINAKLRDLTPATQPS